MIAPGIFEGTLRHRRHAPVAHAFTYPVFMVLLDVDRVTDAMHVSRFTSHNRWNWATFDDRDHLGDPSRPLSERVRSAAQDAGQTFPDGPTFLLTHLRYLGYCFNPVSFFYCFDRHLTLRLVAAEVNNTFGGSHVYWLRPEDDAPTFRASAEKSLYVSPFITAHATYRFLLTRPEDWLTVHMDTQTADGRLFDATLTLERRPWTATEIRRQLLRHPVMTASVTVGIHWQALRLWWKNVPLVPRHTADGRHEREAAGAPGTEHERSTLT